VPHTIPTTLKRVPGSIPTTYTNFKIKIKIKIRQLTTEVESTASHILKYIKK
jgi:hypothetical protein